ncbi:hypothetical protein [Campylobacter iguaniorum]|uniref:hypothetical protein n=1 Tax=Campylobacter iguaniorum TaxID=1244531 RepID=UPI0007C8A556|nr:hypothetical protein [Campylobacter iguaniorum]
MINRDVFYISGFDPRSYRYYYSMFKKNAYKTSKIQSNKISISSIKDKEKPHFLIDYKDTIIKYNFLNWNDIVTANFVKGYFYIFWTIFIWLKAYIFSGLVFKFAKETRTQLIAGFYPFLYILFSYLIVFLVIYFIWKIDLNLALFIFISLLVFYFSSKFIFYIGSKIGVFWLLSIYAFCYKYAKENIKDIDDRIDCFANQILENIKSNIDNKDHEIMIIAHSVGTILAISVLAKVIEKCENNNICIDNLKLVLLGECIPLVSFHKFAIKFRNELEVLSKSKFTWLDFTSTIDGACFPLFDYLKSSNIKTNSGCGPKFLSVRFFKIYEKATYKKIRYQWYKVHFLYLKATQINCGYDYFYLVCDGLKLENKTF